LCKQLIKFVTQKIPLEIILRFSCNININIRSMYSSLKI
jgi:hypothetical protein